MLENDEEKSVAQNIALIISTRKGTLPMYRDFGLPMEYVGKPTGVAEALFLVEATDAIEQFEPRATINNIEVAPGIDGSMFVEMEVTI